MDKSRAKLKELLALKNDAKHPDLSLLAKCSAEFQLELAGEATKQSRNHLYVSIIALFVAVCSLCISILVSVDKLPHWFPLVADEPPQRDQAPANDINSDGNPANTEPAQKEGCGTKQENRESQPTNAPE